MSDITDLNACSSLAHKINKDEVKSGKVKPAENIPHLKGAEAAQLHPDVATCRNGSPVLFIL